MTDWLITMKKNKKNCKSSNITHLLEHEPIDFGLIGVTIGENKSRSHAAPANKQKRTQTKRNLPGRYYHIWSRKEKKKSFQSYGQKSFLR